MKKDKNNNSNFKKKLSKKTIIISTLSAAALITTAGTIAGIASCVNKQKIIREKDEEIKILKLKINDLAIQINQLKQERQRNEEQIAILQQAKSKATKNSILLNKQIQTLIKQSAQINTSVEEPVVEEPTDPNLSTKDMIKKANEELIASIKEQLNSAATKYRNLVFKYTNQKNSYETKLSANVIDAFNKIIEKASNVVNVINTFEYNDISQATENLNRYVRTEKIYLDEQTNLNKVLIDELDAKEKQNDFLKAEIQNSFNKLKDSVKISIKTSKVQLAYVDSLKAELGKYLNKQFHYMNNETAKSLKAQAKELLANLITYGSNLQDSILKVEQAYNNAINTNSYNDLLLIDVERFAKSNNNFKEQLNTIYDSDYDILYKAFQSKSNQYIAKVKENEALKNNIVQLQETLAQTKDNLAKTQEKNANDQAELDALKIKIKEQLSQTLKNTIATLEKVVNSLENADNQATRDLAIPLKKQEEILKSALSQYSSDNFVDQYQPIVASAMESIHNIIESYKQSELIPLKNEYKHINQELAEKNAQLEKINNKVSEVNALYNQTNSILKIKETQLADLSEQTKEKNAQLVEAINNLNEAKAIQSNNLNQAQSNYHKIKELINNAKQKAQELIDEINDNSKTQKLQDLMNILISDANESDFDDIQSKINDLSQNAYDIFNEMLKVQKEYSQEQKETLNSKINELEIEKDNISNQKAQIETELTNAKVEFNKVSQKVQEKNTEIETLNQKANELVAQINDVDTKLKNLKAKNQEIQDEYTSTKQTLAEIKQKQADDFEKDKASTINNWHRMQDILRYWINRINDDEITEDLKRFTHNWSFTENGDIQDKEERKRALYRTIRLITIRMNNLLDVAITKYFNKKIDGGNSNVTQLTNQLNELKVKLNDLKSQKNTLNEKLNSLSALSLEKSNELKQKENDLKTKQAQVEKNIHNINEQIETIKSLKEKNNSLSQEIEETDNEINDLKEKLKEMEKRSAKNKIVTFETQEMPKVFATKESPLDIYFTYLASKNKESGILASKRSKEFNYSISLEENEKDIYRTITLNFQGNQNKNIKFDFDINNLPNDWIIKDLYSSDEEEIINDGRSTNTIRTEDDPNSQSANYSAILKIDSSRKVAIKFAKENNNIEIHIFYIYDYNKKVNLDEHIIIYAQKYNFGEKINKHGYQTEFHVINSNFNSDEDKFNYGRLVHFGKEQDLNTNNIVYSKYYLVNAELKK